MKILFLGFLIVTLSHAQSAMGQSNNKTSFEAYKAQKQKEFADYKSRKQREFDEYRRKKNEEFAAYVRKKWEAFNGQKPKPKPKDQDKPPVVIKDEQRQQPVKDNPIPIKETVTPPKPEPKPEPIAPIQEIPKPAEKWVSFNVFGTGMKVRFEDKQRFRLSGLTEASVADCWQKLSGADYDNMVHDCLQLRDTKKLSDWAYLNMLQRLAEQCVGGHGGLGAGQSGEHESPGPADPVRRGKRRAGDSPPGSE